MDDASFPLFSFGRTVATPSAMALLEANGIPVGKLLERHGSGDWGDLCAADKAANTRALFDQTRLLSSYSIAGEKVYVITEADRSYTTILLASEY